MPNVPPRHHGTAEDLFRLLDQREAAAHGGYSQDPGNWHGRAGWSHGPAIGTPGPGSFPRSSLNWHQEEGWRGAPAMGTPGGYAHQVGGFYPMWGLKGGYIGLNPAGRAFNAPEVPEALGGYGYSHGQGQPLPGGGPGAVKQYPTQGALPNEGQGFHDATMSIEERNRALASRLPQPQQDPSQAMAIEALRRMLAGGNWGGWQR